MGDGYTEPNLINPILKTIRKLVTRLLQEKNINFTTLFDDTGVWPDIGLEGDYRFDHKEKDTKINFANKVLYRKKIQGNVEMMHYRVTKIRDLS